MYIRAPSTVSWHSETKISVDSPSCVMAFYTPSSYHLKVRKLSSVFKVGDPSDHTL